jgi:hypothetical protein
MGGRPLGPAHRGTEGDFLGLAHRRGDAQGSPHLNPNQYRGAWAQHKRGHIGPNRSCNPAENNNTPYQPC